MTREEAVTVLKALMKNPLFSEVHKVAFNIAIHDIKQRHDWDINNLILINKDNYEPLEQEPIIDNIRAKIKDWQTDIHDNEYDANKYDFVFERIFEIIDEYKKESEE